MAIVFICWVVVATVFALALFRASARPVPRYDEEFAAESQEFDLDIARPAPKSQNPRPVPKARAEVLASSYTTL